MSSSDLLPTEEELEAMRRKTAASQTLLRQIQAAGITVGGVSIGVNGSVQITPSPDHPITPVEQVTIDGLIAALDQEAEYEALQDQLAEAAFSRANIIAQAADIRAEAAAGITACDADLATIVTGKTANAAATTIAQLRTVQGGILTVKERQVNREKAIIRAIDDITSLVLHLAKGG